MKPTIPHDQHPGPHAAQDTQAAHSLREVKGPEARIHDGVRPAFDQVHSFELGKRRLSASHLMPTECPHVLWRISDVFRRPIDRHEAQAKEKGSCGFSSRQRPTDGMEERHEGFGSQLIAPVGQGSISRQLGEWVRPEKT
jgi:hypothetical protein